MRVVLVACLALLLLSGDAHAATLTLAWDPPAVGVPDTYLLYRQVVGEPYALLATVEVPTTMFTDTSVPTGDVCYVVSAANSAGESPPSNAACFPSDGPPGAPQQLRLAP